MVQINFAQKQVNAKIVYYGPGMSGKTTNLEVVHQRAPSGNRGELTSISTDGDRTLFFDFMPLDLGTVAGMRTCFQIYTVPGQVYYNSTRKLVLQGVDGVVFVADSSGSMVQENLESLRNLEQNLNEYGKSLATLPFVLQYNKRDLPDAMPVDELNRLLNPNNVPCYEAVASTGQGVFPTLKALAARVLESIHNGARAGSPAPTGQTGFHPVQNVEPAGPIPAAPAALLSQTAFRAGQRPAAPLPSAAVPATAPAHAAAGAQGAVPALHQTGFHAAQTGSHAAGRAQPPRSIPMPSAPPPQAGISPRVADPMARTTIHAPPAPQPTIPLRGTVNPAPQPSAADANGRPGSAGSMPARSHAPQQPRAPAAAARRPAPAARPAPRPEGAARVQPRAPVRPEPAPVSRRGHHVLTVLLVGAALVVGAVAARLFLSGI